MMPFHFVPKMAIESFLAFFLLSIIVIFNKVGSLVGQNAPISDLVTAARSIVASQEVGICESAVRPYGYKCEEFQDGMTWLLNSPEQSLGFVLADAGYDVWIANIRGTRSSRRHVSLHASDRAYWQWSWDELAANDLPAMIDLVSKQTGQKLHYVGHSLGTLIALASFSEGRLVDRLRSAALLCPVAYLTHMRTPLGDNCCLNASTVDLFLKYEPQPTSTKNMVHLAQTFREGALTKYNYGSREVNIEMYGQGSPPAYNLLRIPNNLPMYLSYGGRDSLSDVQDVGHLLEDLKLHDADNSIPSHVLLIVLQPTLIPSPSPPRLRQKNPWKNPRRSTLPRQQMVVLSPSPLLRRRFFHPRIPFYTAVHLRRAASAAISYAARRPSPNKNLLKAKDSIKDLSSLPRLLSPEKSLTLLPDQATGFVASAQANFMRVIVDSAAEPPANDRDSSDKAGTHLLCVVRALLKKIRRRVLVGDTVLVGSVDWVDRRGMIEDVFERKTEIIDPPVANVDHLLVLFSMEQPKLEPFTLTRFLVEAESTGIPFTLVLNKCELVEGEVRGTTHITIVSVCHDINYATLAFQHVMLTISAWEDRLCTWGYEPLFCSIESKYGLVGLEDILKGQTTVIVGPSGVGKSSLINYLRSDQHNEELNDLYIEGVKWLGDQRVGEVSKKSGRGKHITRHVSLLPLTGGGYLADTPGFNQPSLLKVTKKTLDDAFPEIRERLTANNPAQCLFNDCLHLGEPGCIVKGDWERYPYYLQLLDEIKIREEFQLRTFGTKREGDVRYKVGDMGIKQAEPRLELKKHRRVSRRQLNQSILDELQEIDEDWDDAR
ncbi:Triacylglycerol lipase 2 [Apostasia shenzhenica]|uniref:Triacylglycerol lipase 2 n=1 Tax=Apostasia shenzhenica TaxID=1088818 RepID=A0A2I0B7Q5_9ASPA|nr:Triacylglycerol lipase 2 [Apostasia shenzhenica]